MKPINPLTIPRAGLAGVRSLPITYKLTSQDAAHRPIDFQRSTVSVRLFHFQIKMITRSR